MSNTSDWQGSHDEDIVVLKAVAASEGAKIFVSVVNDEISDGIQGPVINKKTLTFFGDYDAKDGEEPLTDLQKYELEKDREANGVLKFQGPGFAKIASGAFSEFIVNQFKAAKFTATKVENKVIKDTYDVTITITGILDVGSGQNQSISAEFKGEGDIRVGEGLGAWHMATRNPNK
ncbi:hypothetical protein BYT27DRAFT_7252135 [Phlegmacium glaucopus]|nr:hypothetical protein BYT27DRAFT_7252135 [Phlegmacium glaucopus]